MVKASILAVAALHFFIVCPLPLFPYRSLDNTVVRFVKIIKKIGDIQPRLPSGIFVGDFNIDHKKASALSEK